MNDVNLQEEHDEINIGVEVNLLLEAWADRRNYDELCELWGGYRCLNGLTDGCEIFLKSLKRLRGRARMQDTQVIHDAEANKINLLIGVVSRMLNNRQ